LLGKTYESYQNRSPKLRAREAICISTELLHEPFLARCDATSVPNRDGCAGRLTYDGLCDDHSLGERGSSEAVVLLVRW
jgi:hypothetical protein